jgi:hypothetical protein
MADQLDADDRNKLSDRTFAFPRVRKEPLNDAKHVRNALARFDQVQDVTDKERDEAFRRIKRAAGEFGVDVTEKSWRELGKPTSSGSSSKSASSKSASSKSASSKSASSRSASSKSAGRSKAELYAEARKRGVEGRSTMTKADLRSALS